MNSITCKTGKSGPLKLSFRILSIICLGIVSLFLFSKAETAFSDETRHGALGLLFREEKQLMKDGVRAPGNKKINQQMADLRANISEELVPHKTATFLFL